MCFDLVSSLLLAATKPSKTIVLKTSKGECHKIRELVSEKFNEVATPKKKFKQKEVRL